MNELKLLLALLLLALTACQLRQLREVDSEVDRNEPFPPPYVETYRQGKEPDELKFIAARHEGGWGPTHLTIDKV